MSGNHSPVQFSSFVEGPFNNKNIINHSGNTPIAEKNAPASPGSCLMLTPAQQHALMLQQQSGGGGNPFNLGTSSNPNNYRASSLNGSPLFTSYSAGGVGNTNPNIPPLDKDFLPVFGPHQQDQQKAYMKEQQKLMKAAAAQLQQTRHMNQSAGATTPLISNYHHPQDSNQQQPGKGQSSLGGSVVSPQALPIASCGGSPTALKAGSHSFHNTGLVSAGSFSSASPSAASPKTQKIADLCVQEIRRTNQTQKISRTKGVAETMCTKSIEKYLRTNEDEGYVNKMMRRMTDEYFMACNEYSSVCPLPPNMTSRFADLQDEFHELVRFGFGAGQQERYNAISQAVSDLEKEVQDVLLPSALEILACSAHCHNNNNNPQNHAQNNFGNNNNSHQRVSSFAVADDFASFSDVPKSAGAPLTTVSSSAFQENDSNSSLFNSSSSKISQKELSMNLPHVVIVSQNTFVDIKNGLVITKWDSCHKGARRYCKSLQKLASAWLNQVFTVPYCLVMEVCGVTFSATSIAPLTRPIRDVTAFSEWSLAIEAITSERGFPVVEGPQGLAHNCRFASSMDGRVYCYHAAGLMMPSFVSPLNPLEQQPGQMEFLSSQLMDSYEGTIEESNEEQEEQFVRTRATVLDKVVDTVRTKQVGVTSDEESSFGPVRTLKGQGLKVADVTMLFSKLYEKDAQLRKQQELEKKNSENNKKPKIKRDRELFDALTTTAAEIIARVLRIIVREYWAENYVPLLAKIRYALKKTHEEVIVENLSPQSRALVGQQSRSRTNTMFDNSNQQQQQQQAPSAGPSALNASVSGFGVSSAQAVRDVEQSSLVGGGSNISVNNNNNNNNNKSTSGSAKKSLAENVDQVIVHMSVFTHQLVELLLTEGSSARPNPSDQLYLHVAELAKKVFPERIAKFEEDQQKQNQPSTFFREPVNTKTWNETMISIVHIAEHLAEKLGMTFADGILCFSQRSLGRVARATTLTPPKSWFRSAVAGLHKENLKMMSNKLQNAVSSSRPDLPDSFPFFIALRQCDIVHQAQETPGVPPSHVFLQRNVAPLIPTATEDDADEKTKNNNNNNNNDKNNKKKNDNDDSDGDELFQDVSNIQASAALASSNRADETSTTAKSSDTIAQTFFTHYLRFTEAMQKVSKANVAVAQIAATSTPQRIALAVSAKAIMAAQQKINGKPLPFDALNLSTITQGSVPGAPNLSSVPKNMTQEMWEAAISVVDEMQREISKVIGEVQSFLRSNKECRALFELAADPHGAIAPSTFVSSSAMLSLLQLNKLRLLVNVARDICHESLFPEFDGMLKDLELLCDRGIITRGSATVSFISIMDAAVALYIHPLTLESHRRNCLEFSHRKVDFAKILFGESSIQWAAAVADVGALYMKLGDLESAKNSYDNAFTRLREIAPNHSTTLAAGNNLGCILFRLAHTRMDAKSKRKRLASLYFKFPPPVEECLVDAVVALQYVVVRATFADAKTLSDAYSNIGSICVYRAKYSKALPYFEEALKLTRGLLSDTHPERASIIRNRIMCEKRIQASACVRIACQFRMWLARREVRKRRAERNALVTMQSVGRAYLVRKTPLNPKWDFYRVATFVVPPSSGTSAFTMTVGGFSVIQQHHNNNINNYFLTSASPPNQLLSAPTPRSDQSAMSSNIINNNNVLQTTNTPPAAANAFSSHIQNNNNTNNGSTDASDGPQTHKSSGAGSLAESRSGGVFSGEGSGNSRQAMSLQNFRTRQEDPNRINTETAVSDGTPSPGTPSRQNKAYEASQNTGQNSNALETTKVRLIRRTLVGAAASQKTALAITSPAQQQIPNNSDVDYSASVNPNPTVGVCAMKGLEDAGQVGGDHHE